MKRISEQHYYERRGKHLLSPLVVKSTAKEILSLADKKLKKPRKELVVLDVGCGTGEYSFELEKYVKGVVGVEPYMPAYKKAMTKKDKIGSGVSFYNRLIEDFKTKDKFDLVLSLTTVEHMPYPEKSFEQIFNLMGKGGMIYLTAPNKWWPFENHYRLFFLSWLPLPLANLYVRATRRGNSYIDSAYSRSYFGMKRFFDGFPCEYEFILPSHDASYLGCGYGGTFYKLLKKIGIRLIRIMPLFWCCSKGFIMVIRNKPIYED